NSRPSPCLRVMKLPFCAGEFLPSPTAATLRVNATSESTKTLRNFIELLPAMHSELLCERAGTTIKQQHSHRPDDQQPARKTCSYLQLNKFHLLLGFSILLHGDHDGCRVRNSSRLGRDH